MEQFFIDWSFPSIVKFVTKKDAISLVNNPKMTKESITTDIEELIKKMSPRDILSSMELTNNQISFSKLFLQKKFPAAFLENLTSQFKCFLETKGRWMLNEKSEEDFFKRAGNGWVYGKGNPKIAYVFDHEEAPGFEEVLNVLNIMDPGFQFSKENLKDQIRAFFDNKYLDTPIHPDFMKATAVSIYFDLS